MARHYQPNNVLSITRMRKTFARRFIYLIITGVFALSLVAYFGGGQIGTPGGASREYQEQPVVTVNGEAVPRIQYTNMWNQYKQFAGGNETQSLTFQGMVLTQIVDQALQRSIAKKRGLKVSDADIDKAILEQKKQMGGGKPVSEDEFREMLKRQGASIDDLREELSERLLPQKLQEEIAKQVPVTEAEHRKSYDEVKVRHILVDTKKLPEAQAKAKAEKILAEVKAGGDFAALANKYSDDPGNTDQKFDAKAKAMVPTGNKKGGDQGWNKIAQLPFVPEFSDAVKKLEPGQISEPVKTQFGYHIIKVDQKRSSLPKDFEKNKAKLLEEYKTQQSGQKFQQLMEEERKKAKIVWHDPSLEWRYLYSKNNPMMGMVTPDSMGGQDELEKKLREYLKTNAGDSGAALVLGKQLYQKYIMAAPGAARDKARQEVIDSYETALKGMEDQETRMSLAQLYRDAGKKDEALKQYRTVQRLLRWDDSPATKTVHGQLEMAFKELGDKDSADKSRKRIVELTAIEKQQEAEKKAAEAKAKEEAKKNAAKPGSTPATSGTITVGKPGEPAKPGTVTVTAPGDKPAAPTAESTAPAAGKTSTQPGHEGHAHP